MWGDLLLLDLVLPGIFELAHVIGDGLATDSGRASFLKGLTIGIGGDVELGMRAFGHDNLPEEKKKRWGGREQ